MKTYTITFTFPVPDEDSESYVQSIIEFLDDESNGQANIIECKEVQP